MVFGDLDMIHRVEDLEYNYSTYIVIDVKYFSSTVVELFSNGIEEVFVTKNRGDELEFKAEYSEDVIIGGSTVKPRYVPEQEYDFFNSPAAVHDVSNISLASKAALTSTNGGRTVHKILENADDNSEMFIGSTTNAKALGEYIDKHNIDHSEICLIPCGVKGLPAAEDYIGALHIAAYITGTQLSEKVLHSHYGVVKNAKGPYEDRPEHRKRDIEIITDFSSRDVVPHSTGQTIRNAIHFESSSSTSQ